MRFSVQGCVSEIKVFPVTYGQTDLVPRKNSCAISVGYGTSTGTRAVSGGTFATGIVAIIYCMPQYDKDTEIYIMQNTMGDGGLNWQLWKKMKNSDIGERGKTTMYTPVRIQVLCCPWAIYLQRNSNSPIDYMHRPIKSVQYILILFF